MSGAIKTIGQDSIFPPAFNEKKSGINFRVSECYEINHIKMEPGNRYRLTMTIMTRVLKNYVSITSLFAQVFGRAYFPPEQAHPVRIYRRGFEQDKNIN